MTYYRIDSVAIGSGRGTTGAICATLMEALQGLRTVRVDEHRNLNEWISALGTATERALRLFDQHVDSVFRTGEAALPRQVATSEHTSIRRSLLSQLAMARDAAGGTTRNAAVRLLDAAVDTECLIALHINGLAASLRSEPEPVYAAAAPVERAGPLRTGANR